MIKGERDGVHKTEKGHMLDSEENMLERKQEYAKQRGKA